MSDQLPPIPYPEFPLRPHPNGQWSKSVWNPRKRRSELKYFGTWRDDLDGDRALNDPVNGWLARRLLIRSGADQSRSVAAVDTNALTLGELMGRFLAFNKRKVDAGDLSLRTLNDYLIELPKFVAFLGAQTPVAGLRPEHFSAYMDQLIRVRKLGRHSRRRTRVYINAMLNYGVTNGWMQFPPTGSEWVAPAVDPESMRVARMRAGQPDNHHRIFTGEEIDKLLAIATPSWQAIILLAVNCGLGPADIGRMRWKHICMRTGKLDYPRGKTGVARIGYVWKRTRNLLRKVRKLKRSQAAIAREGNEALIFLSELGNPMYSEAEKTATIIVEGKPQNKLVGVRYSDAIPCTFGRLIRKANLKGLSFYRFRHTTKTLGKAARDPDALDLVMGHTNRSTGKLYDHSEIDFRRVKHVALAVKRGSWQSPISRTRG